MQAQKEISYKEHTLYQVDINHSRYTTSKVLIVEGYSTEADIPQIIAINIPGATVKSYTKISTKLVPSVR